MRVGLDMGGTKTDAVVVDSVGAVAARVRLATGWGGDEIVRTAVAAVRAVATDAAVGLEDIESVGIGIPGQIEAETGRVAHAVNLGVDELDLAGAVAPALGIPVRVENDVKAAAFGAYALRGGASGFGIRHGSMAYLNLGTGIAAGIVANGELWRGARGTAGEVGHISVDPHGPLCRCGQRGCIEALAGGGAIAERWGRPAQLPVRDVFDAADAGDPEAKALRVGLARGVAAGVRILVLTADVDVVVLGGGVTALGQRLMTDVAAELAASAEASPFMRSLRLDERVELLPTGSPAAALGAALIGAHDPEPEEVLARG
ncbi:ROK family protein [Microbacterium sp. BK668]|uniref:ROK family protein n=1 Tax=Microbacterium sp. BK668 TaxID=2512118 RepID=UPI00105E0AAB|nr:ROK family protein [Microbacterium sp. BK668]TDN87706.1 putative NBD/HSP70 family sugar kinase [Microbacterium sp. BK668]